MSGVGRPLKFKSAKKLQEQIDGYFSSCFEEKTIVKDDGEEEKVKIQIKPYTITGLALFLDTDRQTLLNYENRMEYFDTIKKAKTKIEAFAEECLFTNRNTAGVIFNLKNNYNWVDKQEVEHSGVEFSIKLPTDMGGDTNE